MQITPLILFLPISVIYLDRAAGSVSSHLPVLVGADNDNKIYNACAANDTISRNYRLPNETHPEHYDIKLSTNVHLGEKAFQGEVIIDIVVVNATRNIVMHARQMEIIKVTITNPSTNESEELSHKFELECEFLTLSRKLDQQFVAGSKWKITITYRGELLEDKGGFLLSKYIDDDGNKRYLAVTQFESSNARHAFPCYDEPDKRANFSITINHSPNYTAISNMPVNKALSSAGQTVFLTTSRIPTLIVGFVISDFEYTEEVVNGIPLRVYSRPNAKNKQEWALRSGVEIAKFLTNYYGVELMAPKIDHVAVPDYPMLALDSLGLPIYNENSLLYDENISSVFDRTSITKAIAYEISRQWFNDYITIEWWTFLWLKECLANIITNRALDGTFPEWGVWQEFHVVEYQTALDTDSTNTTRPMTTFVQTPDDIKNSYDSISYYTAPSVLLMWNNALNDKIFQKGLRYLSKKNQNSTANEDQFFAAIQTAVEEANYSIPGTISDMMSTWTRQGSYPILTVTRDYECDTFTVKQQAFYNNETLRDNKTWYVPFNYAVASNPDFSDTEATHYLANVTEMKVHDSKVGKNDWLILNKQSTGFYRINYDSENWKLIAEGLIKKPFEIHVRNRAQLMHDAFHLSTSNRLDHSILFKMLTYLKQEDQYAPWSTASDILVTYNRFLRCADQYDEFRLFTADLVRPIFRRLGVNEVHNEPLYYKATRSLVIDIACAVGVAECLEETNNKLQDLVQNKTQLEPSFEESIFCNGLRQSNDREFHFVFQKLIDSETEDRRSLFIYCLTHSQNENHIKTLLYSTTDLSNELRTDERSLFLKDIYQRGETNLLTCIDFLEEKWIDYGHLKSSRGGLSALDDDIRGMAASVANKKQEEKLLALVAKVKNSKQVTASLEADVKKQIADNFHWLRKHGKAILSWIVQYHADSGV